MTETNPRYLSEVHRRRQDFLSLLRDAGAAEDVVQRAAKTYPVEKGQPDYSWNQPMDYQDLAGAAKLPLTLAQKAYKDFEKLCF